MVVVAGVELDEYVVLACGEVAFHYFGNVAQSLDHFLELGGIAEEESDVGAGVVAEGRGVDEAPETP